MANGSSAKAASKPKGEGFFAKLWKFLKESYVETKERTAWPTWQELRSFTLIVLFALLVVAAWIGGIDFILTEITKVIGKSK